MPNAPLRVMRCTLLFAFLGACIPQAAPSNPFDPALPLEEQAKASITGTVSGLDSGAGVAPTPLVGAAAAISGPTTPTPMPVTTDANGFFEFTELTPGDYTVTVSHATHYPSTLQITLGPGEVVSQPVVLALLNATNAVSQGHITGVAEKQGELALPAAQQDHSGIVVEIDSMGARTVTNTAGTYDIFVTPGTYTLAFSASQYNPTTRTNVVATAGAATPVPTVVLQTNPGSIAGNVTIEGQTAGAYSTVTLTIAGGYSTTSDANGNYVFGNIPGGQYYTITATLSRFDPQTVTGVNVVGGGQTNVAAIAMPLSRGTVRGVVDLVGTDDDSGVTVGITGTSLTGVTNVAGAFSIPLVPVGTYALTARLTGYVQGSVPSLTVTANLTTDVGTLTLPSAQGAFTINGGATYTNSPNVTLQLTAQDAAHMLISLDPNFLDPTLGDTSAVVFSQTANFTLNGADGLKTVYVQYIDTTGISGPLFTNTIVLDTTPPSLGTPATSISLNASGFTNSLSNVITLNATGATVMQVSCSGTLAGAQWIPYATTYTCLLDSGDGNKSVAVAFADNANNITTAPPLQFYYDGTAPTATTIANQSLIVNEPNFVVSLSAAVTDANITQDPNPSTAHFIYQLKGGQYANWTDCGTALPALNWAQDATCSGPPFVFQLAQNRPNNLNVRGRDRGGNVGYQDTVTIVEDSNAPGAVIHPDPNSTSIAWGPTDVDAGEGYVVLTWSPPAGSTDTAGYFVYYGSTPGASAGMYNGTFADQGSSPINVGSPCTPVNGVMTCNYRLTGLPDGQEIFVNIAAYDSTQVPQPNLGPLAGSGVPTTPAALVLRAQGGLPNSALSVNPNAQARSVVVQRGLAYITSGPNGNLAVVDTSSPSQPVVMGMTSAPLGEGWRAHVHGTYVYVADGGALVTVDVSNPANPNIVNVNPTAAMGVSWVTGNGDLIFTTANGGSPANPNANLSVFTTAPGSCGNTSGMATPCLVGALNTNDLFTGLAAQGNYVFAAGTSGPNGMLYTIDVSNPVNPNLVGSTHLSTTDARTVEVSGRLAYVSGDPTTVEIVDITNPIAPMVLTQSITTTSAATSVTVYGNTVYAMTDFGIDTLALSASPQNVTLSPTANYPFQADTDPNKYGPYAGSVDAEGNFMYLAAVQLGFQIFRTTAVRGLASLSSAPTAFSLNGPIGVSGSLVFWGAGSTTVAAYANPDALATYASSNNPPGASAQGVAHDGDWILSADTAAGLGARRVLQNANFTAPTYAAPPNYHPCSVLVDWPYAFTLNQNIPNTFTEMSVVNLRNFTIIGQVPIGHATSTIPTGRMAQFGQYVYIPNGSGGPANFYIVNVANPTAPTATPLTLPFTPYDIAQSGTLLYVSAITGSGPSATYGVHVLSVSGAGSPTAPVDMGNFMMAPSPGPVTVSGNYVYYSSDPQLQILDATNPAAITLRGEYSLGLSGGYATPVGNTVYITSQQNPIEVLQLK